LIYAHIRISKQRVLALAKSGGSIRRAVKSIDLQHSRARQNTTVNNFDIKDLVDWLRVADRGDPVKQARISLEILEKSFDIAQCHATRAEAVASIDWDILPPKDVPESRMAEAEAITTFTREILQNICPHPSTGLTGMEGLYKDMQSALVPGYSMSQIRWSDNIGSNIDGFEFYQQDFFTFKDNQGNQSRWPLLIQNGSQHHPTQETIKLHPNSWVVHTHLPRSGDMTRGGMIRPLGYLYLLGHFNLKNWARFNERHGLPFLGIKYDHDQFLQFSDENNEAAEAADSDYKLDWSELKDLAENFANDGAALIPEGMVDIDFHEASNCTGEVFEKFDNMIKQKISQIILGQDSTNSSENANRSIGGVHYQVKHEILVRDCKSISNSVNQQIIAPLVYFNFGNTDLIPRHKFAFEPPADLQAISGWVADMDSAGYEIEDLEELNKRFGVRFKRKEAIDANNSN
jgi:phage gp29-like protein